MSFIALSVAEGFMLFLCLPCVDTLNTQRRGGATAMTHGMLNTQTDSITRERGNALQIECQK